MTGSTAVPFHTNRPMGTTWRVDITRIDDPGIDIDSAAAYSAPTARDAAMQFADDCGLPVDPHLTLVAVADDNEAFVEIIDDWRIYLVTARRNTDDA